VLTDYEELAPHERNVLRLYFCDRRLRETQHWERDARLVVAAFRADTVRAGVCRRAKALVDELIEASPDFARMWRTYDVKQYGEGIKLLHHSVVGPIALEYASFAVDSRRDLSLLIFTPRANADREAVATALAARRRLMRADE